MIGIALAIGLGLGLDWMPTSSGATGGSGAEELPVAPEKGARAPDFTLEDLDGNLIRLSDLRGRVVLVNFWATWCGPCRFEMPAFQARFEQLQPELAILAVDFDEPRDQVLAFAQEFGLTFNVLLDPGAEVQDLYRVRGYPSSVFVEQNGVIQIVHIGIMTESQLDGYLEQLGLLD